MAEQRQCMCCSEKQSSQIMIISVFAFFLFFLFSRVNSYLFESLWATYYQFAVPVLTVWTICRNRKNRLIEYRLLVVFWIWFIISRLLNGDYALKAEYNQVVDLALMIPFFALGINIDKNQRERFLNWFSAITGGFFFALGCVCIYSFSNGIDIPNKITQQFFVSTIPNSDFIRINIMDTNVDATAFWFMESFLLMIYQFFSCGRTWWKLPIALSAIVDYIVIGMTGTRSVFLGVSFALGMTVVLVLLERHFIRKKGMLIAVFLAVFCITAFAAYKGFYRSTEFFGRISVSKRYEDLSDEERDEVFKAEYTDTRRAKSITKFSSGRFWIYRAALRVIYRNPQLWLRGCLYDDSAMMLTETMKEGGGSSQGAFVPHYQNYLVQVLVVDGVLGFLIVISFSLLFVFKALRYFFSHDTAISTASKTLVFPIAASMIYGMLESCFFTATDLRTLFYFLMSGLFLGNYYDKMQ